MHVDIRFSIVASKFALLHSSDAQLSRLRLVLQVTNGHYTFVTPDANIRVHSIRRSYSLVRYYGLRLSRASVICN
jgi:hypothetical protein